MRTIAALGLAATSVLTLATPAHATEDAVGNPTRARYDGRTIDLSRDWDGAEACIELGVETRCYRSDAELRNHHPEVRSPQPKALGLLSTCGTSLAVYDLTNHAPPVVYFTTIGVYHNLSSFGFDNRTSSYAIGACTADFYADAHGGGSVYPGNTSAFASANSMAAGWNNRVSSLFIY